MNRDERGIGERNGLLYRLLHWLICLIFPPIFRLCYGFRVSGQIPREALLAGGISLCNHVHMLDCIMVGLAFRAYKLQYLTLAANLRIPVAGMLVRWLGGIPIPKEIEGWKQVYARVERAFARGEILQIYPEEELLSGCKYLRPFHSGAFRFAVKYQKPVIPCVLRPYGRGKSRRGLELVILPALYADASLPAPKAREKLQQETEFCMRIALEGKELGPCR